MFGRASTPRVLFFVFLMRLSALAQPASVPSNSTGASGSEKQVAATRQAAMNLLEEVLAGTGALALPQNRLAIELEAFPMISARSQPRARALVNQMVAEFAQAAGQSDPSHEFQLPKLRQERAAMINALAQTDAEIALQFLTATLPYVQATSPRDEGPDDDSLRLALAAQIAVHDPQRALQMAKQQLQSNGELAPALVDLLEQVERGDAQSGAQLFRDLVQRVKQTDLVGEPQNLSFAAALLASQFTRQSENGGTADDALRSLAEAVATAVSSPLSQEGLSWAWSEAWPALNSLMPARAAALRQKTEANPAVTSPGRRLWQDFNDARSKGDDDKVARLIEQAPEDQRPAMAEQGVWQFANSGDLQRTRQIAEALNPWQANNAIQQALRSAAVAAGEKGNFAAAHQLAAQITDEDDRATLLSQVALQANHAAKPRLAEEMLGEATSLLLNHSAGTSAFTAQLAVAQAYLQVNAAQAVPLLERSASQLDQVLTAAVQLDGFLPDPHSFEGSELILNRGFLYQSLIQPYAAATAGLATSDLSAARALADRLPLPEARLMTELFVARRVLDDDDDDDKDQGRTSKNRTTASHPVAWLERY